MCSGKWCEAIRAGTLEEGAVVGYREEPGVAPNSNTETFAALKLSIDNWRWRESHSIFGPGSEWPSG